MKCHICDYQDTKVIESRDVADGESTRRRRKCSKCNARFTTYERRERPQLVVVKHDGSRQLFNRNKLLAGLLRACEKTPVTTMQLEAVVSKIEDKLINIGDQEVSSQVIGELAMQELVDLSEVAYVRFASVYRRFTDISGFESELADIRSKKNLR